LRPTMTTRLASELHNCESDGTVADASLISNSSGGLSSFYHIESKDHFGVSAGSLGDLDGDGTNDLVVGALNDDGGAGAVYVLFLTSSGGVKDAKKISNSSGNLSRFYTLNSGDFFGVAVAGIGDLDGDSVLDLACGSMMDDFGGTNSGAIYLLFLSRFGNVKGATKIYNTFGGYTFDESQKFGSSIARIDNFDDRESTLALVVGATGCDDGGANSGAVVVLFLTSNGSVIEHQRISNWFGGLSSQYTLSESDSFGWAVDSLGDLDVDGVNDIAVGSNGDDSGGLYNSGAVFIIFLKTSGEVKSAQKISNSAGGLSTFVTLNTADYFGRAVACLGDLDGDDIVDVAAGAFQDSDGGTGVGAIYIMFLDTGGSVQRAQKISALFGGLKSFVNLENNGYFGRSIANIGDLDSNGVPELIIGAHWAGPSQSGSAYVCFLSQTGCTTGGPTVLEGATIVNRTSSQVFLVPGSDGFALFIGISSVALAFFGIIIARNALRLFQSKKERREKECNSATCILNELRARGSQSGSEVEMTGEQTIMHSVGSALVNNDTFSLVIPPEFIVIHECIAVGGFGQVHKGEYGGEVVAIKKIFAQLTEGLLEEFNHELRILTNLRGVPHVLLLHGVSFQVEQGERVFIMVLEWCPISLASLIKRANTSVDEIAQESSSGMKTLISPKIFLAIFQQLAAVLHILHNKGYVHRDLKPQNILFANKDDLESSLRLCDFGTSRITDPETGLCPMIGDLNGISPPYCPPEVIPAMALKTGLQVGLEKRRSSGFSDDGSTYDGRAFDVYSVGIVMWECWHQQEPELTSLDNRILDMPTDAPLRQSSSFSSRSWAEENLQKTLDGYRPDPTCANGPLGSMPSALNDLQASLCQPDPASRPRASVIKTLFGSQAFRRAIDDVHMAWINPQL